MRSELMEQRSEEQVAWSEIKSANEKSKVLFAKAIGIEDIEHGSVSTKCLKLSYKGILGYLPITLIDRYEFRGIQTLVGKVFEFCVNYVDIEERIFGADRVKALDILSKQFWKKAEAGQKYEAFVRGVDAFNLYLLVEGVPTKLHRDEFSYRFQTDLREVVEIGAIIDVQLMSYVAPTVEDPEGKIVVSKKALEEDPKKYVREYQEKATYLGTIVNIHMDHGLFVELPIGGVTIRTNFPPSTDMSLLNIGQQVNVKIQSIDYAKGEIKGIIILPTQGFLKKKQPPSRKGLI